MTSKKSKRQEDNSIIEKNMDKKKNLSEGDLLTEFDFNPKAIIGMMELRKKYDRTRKKYDRTVAQFYELRKKKLEIVRNYELRYKELMNDISSIKHQHLQKMQNNKDRCINFNRKRLTNEHDELQKEYVLTNAEFDEIQKKKLELTQSHRNDQSYDELHHKKLDTVRKKIKVIETIKKLIDNEFKQYEEYEKLGIVWSDYTAEDFPLKVEKWLKKLCEVQAQKNELEKELKYINNNKQ